MTTDPMKQYFDALRQDLKEMKDRRAILDRDIHELEQLDAFLREHHSSPDIQYMVKRSAYQAMAQEKPRHKLPEAICLQFTDPGMRLTVREIAMFLEDMRQRGELDTKSEGITHERTSKAVRKLTKENRLVRESTKAGNRTIYVYRLV